MTDEVEVKHKLGIVVPYRDRELHLMFFLPYMTKFLDKQNLDYKFYIVEQHGFHQPFNRAKLLNVGFVLAKSDCDYFVFHDIDHIPENSDADYSYSICPTHMSGYAAHCDYKVPYDTMFGGVSMFTKEDFLKVNGFSNEYWGWGAEDDDLYTRCQQEGLGFARRLCRYTCLPHDGQSRDNYSTNCEIWRQQREEHERHKRDGISTLQYLLIGKQSIADNAMKYTVAI